jgi:hypothetical protein
MNLRRALGRVAVIATVLVGLAGQAEAGLVLPNYRLGNPDLTVNGLQFDFDFGTGVLEVNNLTNILGNNISSFGSVPGHVWDGNNSSLNVTFNKNSNTGSFSIGDGANFTTGDVSAYYLNDKTLQFLFSNINNGITGLTFGPESVFWATTTNALNLGGSFADLMDSNAKSDTFNVPEPGTVALLAIGLIAVARRRYSSR